MLKTRVITAAVLLAGLLPILFFAPPVFWAVLTLGFLAAAAWEWACLTQAAPGQPHWPALLMVLTGALWLVLKQRGDWPHEASVLIYLVASIFWCLLAPLWMWQKRNLRNFGGLGWFLLLAAWMALVEARQQGIAFMLSVMLLVWLADIGAYFSGKALGRHKLAPMISPGKTWEGVAGGLLTSLFVAFWLAQAAWSGDTFFAVWLRMHGLLELAAMLVLLVAISVIGDLFESLLKRQAGVKDSSHLLPGHGGVLDRIDALLPVLPLAMLAYFLSVA